MKTFLWKIQYTYHIRRLVCVPWRIGWQMAGSTVESLFGRIEDESPKEAAEEERDEWLQCL